MRGSARLGESNKNTLLVDLWEILDPVFWFICFFPLILEIKKSGLNLQSPLLKLWLLFISHVSGLAL